MLFLKILAVLALLILLLCLLRLGVRASWGTETHVTAILGPVRLQLVPKREKKPKPQKEKPPRRRRKNPRRTASPSRNPGRRTSGRPSSACSRP